ncbi:MAG: hypothetical protein WC444_00305 [Candidatus Paceibacterota bacterium]
MSDSHGGGITGGKIFGIGLGAGGAILSVLGGLAMGLGWFGPVAQQYPALITGGITMMAVGTAVYLINRNKSSPPPAAKKEEAKKDEAKH